MKINLFISKEMKKFQLKFYSIITMVLLLLTVSCQDLTEINTSPNQLNASDINVKYVLTSVLSSSGNKYVRENVYGATVTISEAMQYMQRDYIDFAQPNGLVWGPVAFTSNYGPLVNSQYIYENAKSEVLEGNQKFYTAVGQIMRSFWFGFLTSLYGDIPYSEAMKATEGNYTPVYDAQKDIFKGILADLKSANELLASVTTVDGASSADLMFQGDVLKWRKFANSLRLRYLMRLSEKSADAGFDVKAEFNAIAGNPSANPVFTSSSDNAAIPYIGSDAANSWYGGPLNWTNRSEYYRRKPCITFVKELRTNSDPRLTSFIRPTDAQLKVSSATPEYVKLSDGQIIRNVPASTTGVANIDTARYNGLPAAMNDPNLFNLLSSTNFNSIKALNSSIYTDLAANPHVSYLSDMYAMNVNPLVKAVLMSYAELNFIMAEARQRGWITTSTAVDYYKAGITASLRQYLIADGSK
ncbi:MAG TPA: SusD/RagB family nutrient-binding outer membrane lipoprotein, partial [Prolixibacteraceae bacterium]|nr:SusD/RagB family nutrient-binding outer membrane lipoprotein [Prolixibacteraceae bacterium]